MLVKVDNKTDMLEMHIWNYEGFSFTYSSIQCYNVNEDCDKAVVERIVPKHQKTSEDQETAWVIVTILVYNMSKGVMPELEMSGISMETIFDDCAGKWLFLHQIKGIPN
jgi:hypothetical protein